MQWRRCVRAFGGKSSPTDTRNLLFRLILARRPNSYSDSTGSTGAALFLRRRFGRGAGGAFLLPVCVRTGESLQRKAS